MDIKKLFEALSMQEKNELFSMIEQERTGIKQLNVSEWCEKMGASVRLSNVLNKFGNGKFPIDVTWDEFRSKPIGGGHKSWAEFEELRGY